MPSSLKLMKLMKLFNETASVSCGHKWAISKMAQYRGMLRIIFHIADQFGNVGPPLNKITKADIEDITVVILKLEHWRPEK